ncbi:hypothetical protein L211DRAFT_590773 [Terfezia boudieri ATCC MYA-4762]|uniref:Uncharacterized protein n=1 Tax=Terfezia boudieri ATCC MYA-4762 TaxID=1051890 RepID=A0A3N4LP53_9PEZI|nr:hypothetical protein L211DRAFT_590773 [Terfezia boudieri ATCC MYA-4762]
MVGMEIFLLVSFGCLLVSVFARSGRLYWSLGMTSLAKYVASMTFIVVTSMYFGGNRLWDISDCPHGHILNLFEWVIFFWSVMFAVCSSIYFWMRRYRSIA